MAAKKRNYKQDYKLQQERGELPNRMERQRARRKLDSEGVSRVGKDVAHVVALSKGGSNKNGVRLETPAKNRSFKRNSSGAMVSETSTKERKKK